VGRRHHWREELLERVTGFTHLGEGEGLWGLDDDFADRIWEEGEGGGVGVVLLTGQELAEVGEGVVDA